MRLSFTSPTLFILMQPLHSFSPSAWLFPRVKRKMLMLAECCCWGRKIAHFLYFFFSCIAFIIQDMFSLYSRLENENAFVAFLLIYIFFSLFRFPFVCLSISSSVSVYNFFVGAYECEHLQGHSTIIIIMITRTHLRPGERDRDCIHVRLLPMKYLFLLFYKQLWFTEFDYYFIVDYCKWNSNKQFNGLFQSI